MRRSWTALILSFLLGAGLMFASLRLLPLLQFGAGGVENLSLVIPAVTNKTYRYRQNRGFTAVLASEDGRRLELPAAWLPGSGARGGFRVETGIDLGTSISRFTVVIEKLE